MDKTLTNTTSYSIDDRSGSVFRHSPVDIYLEAQYSEAGKDHPGSQFELGNIVRISISPPF